MFPFKNAGTAYTVPCDDTAVVIDSVSDGANNLYLLLYYTTFLLRCKEFVENVRKAAELIAIVLEKGHKMWYYNIKHSYISVFTEE